VSVQAVHAVRGNSAAGPGGRARVSRAKEWAELQARSLAILCERMNGNGEVTETQNFSFDVSYEVLTKFLRMNVILTYFHNGNGLTARIRVCWKSGVKFSVLLSNITFFDICCFCCVVTPLINVYRRLEIKIKYGARTRGTYYILNAHRNICNRSVNLQ